MVARWSEYGALPLRGLLGVLCLALGYAKLVEPGLARTARALEAVGLAPGTTWAPVAGLVEILGGVALLVGVVTRWAALALALESLAALVAVAAGAVVNVEARVAMLAGFLALGLLGPQRYALDLRVPALASWTGAGPSEPARKAA